MDTVDEVLSHYGVKGMHWGQKKASGGSSSSTPQDVAVRTQAGKRLRTTGGRGHAPTHDAIETAVIKQKARKSKTQSLSNQELQAAIRRMQLEQQFSQLRASSSTTGKGKKFVKELLGLGKTANEVNAFSNTPTGKTIKDSLKR